MKNITVKKQIAGLAIVTALVMMTAMFGAAVKAPAYAAEDNLAKAKSVLGISGDCPVFEAGAGADLRTLLSDAGGRADAAGPVIVHVVSGSYNVGSTSQSRLIVPENVVMVAEDGVSFKATGSADDSMVQVAGSLFGGSYDGGSTVGNIKQNNVIKLMSASSEVFSGVNGVVSDVTVKASGKNGILIIESYSRNAKVLDSTVTDCVENGISAERNSHVSLIENCTCNHNGLDENGSGINLSHSEVDVIRDCTLNNNGDKGVSTNSDPVPTAKQTGCSIGEISGCTISNNKQNGVYIKPMCSLGSFTGNTVEGNPDGIVANGKTASGTKGKSQIKKINNNRFTGNTNSNIGSQWSGAVVYVGKNNVINGAGKTKNNIVAFDGGTVRITGSKNSISRGGNCGISVSGNNSKLYITGSNNKIFNNKTQGIYAKGKKTVVSLGGKNNQIYGNKKMGIAVYNGTAVTVSGSGLKVQKNKGAGVYVVKSSLTIKGSGMQVTNSTDMGIMATGSTVKSTGKKLVIKNNKKAGIGIYDKTKLTISGSGTQILKNGKFAVYAKGRGTSGTLRKCKLPSGKNKGIYKTGGAKVKA